jgi:PA domain/Glucodextranase, domain B/Leishmanolysin
MKLLCLHKSISLETGVKYFKEYQVRKFLLCGLLILLALPSCSRSSVLELIIASPADGATINIVTVTVDGSVNRDTATVSYTLNGAGAKAVSVNASGAFSFDTALKVGTNTLTIKATDGATTDTTTLKLISEPTITTYNGKLDSSRPTFVRPNPEGYNLTSTQLTVPYNAYKLDIIKASWYAVTSEHIPATNNTDFDGYLLLYKGSFNPLKPSENLIGNNDDGNCPFNCSRIQAQLAVGSYVVVTTACGDSDLECGPFYGSFKNKVAPTVAPPTPYQLPVPDDTKFNITLRFVTNNITADQQAVFVDAANRWAEIIKDDLSNIPLNGPVEFNPNAAAFEGTVDDVVIDASFVDIDGPSQVLGRAGPRYVRTGDDKPLTIYGSMEFDIAEFAPGGFFEDPKGYADVILHEMGHVLGIGTLWDATGTLAGFDPNAPTDLPLGTPNLDYDPRFTGVASKAEYTALLGSDISDAQTGVPVENTGGTGSINSHWRELTFDNELMSPSASGTEALSRLTAASLSDIGYGVDLESAALDAYALPLPPTFKQLTPIAKTYVNFTDFLKLSGGAGAASGMVQAVDLKIDEMADPTNPASAHPENSTSGCEAADFAGFASGRIALLQRGECPFTDKVDNAKAAGAIGVIIFNQGNTSDRKGLFGGSSSGLPGVGISYDLGVALAGTPGLSVQINNPVAPASLETAALKPAFQEEVLLPVGSISSNGTIKLFPSR